jgi:ABC-type sulfate transport system permease component
MAGNITPSSFWTVFYSSLTTALQYGFGSWAKFFVSSLAQAILTRIQDVPVVLPSIVATMVLAVFYYTGSLILVSNVIHWYGQIKCMKVGL